MRKHSKLILASLTATMAMALALSGTASARVFSIDNMNFRVVWRSLEFIDAGGLVTVRCPVTIEGSFHSQTISKVEKALIGHVSRATVAEASCSGGRATVHQTSLPWHITYNGFRGILPRINSIRLLLYGPAFQIFSGFQTCTATTTSIQEARGEAIIDTTTHQIVNIIPDPNPQIHTNEGCFITQGMFRAPETDGAVTLLGTTTKIHVTLI
jgi:hypothetical protein